MKNLFIVTIYTILQTFKKKSFIISNIIIAIFILLMFVIVGQYLEDIANKADQTYGTEQEQIPVILIDNTETFGEYIYEANTEPYVFVLLSEKILEEAKEANDEDNIELLEQEKGLKNIDSLQEVSFEELINEIINAIKNNEIQYAITVKKQEKDIDKPFLLEFLCSKERNIDKTEKILLENILKTIYKDNLIDSSGIDLPALNLEITSSIRELDSSENLDKGNYIVATLVAVLLYLAIYLYGHSISSSIASEKMSRIIETLVTSTKPRIIVIGKTIGMGILGLLQLIFLIFITIFAYKNLIPDGLTFANSIFANVNINAFSIIILLIFFVLGYLLYAFSFAVVGAIISKTEDLQIASMPISIISLFSFYLSIFTANISQTSISKFASFFPFSTAFAIPAKVLAGYISIEEVYVGMGILLLTVVFVAFIAVRIYSNVILNYGNKVKIKDLFNLFLNIK